MRRVVGASLVALVGCNQIFGLAPTQEYDAGADVVPFIPRVVLDWQIAAVVESSGAPDPTISFAPIVPAPKIRLATIDGAFGDGIYSSDDGTIQIPQSYLNTSWRLEYTLAGDIPHEVQWAPEDQRGHLTVPIFGRLARETVPTGGGYTITPTGVASYTLPRVFTTGLWTEAKVNNYVPANGARVDFDFLNATSLSGPKGRPDPTHGDRAFLVDYAIDGGSMCRVAVGSAALASAAIEPGMHSMHTPPWDLTRVDVMAIKVDVTFITRLRNALDKLHSTFSTTLSTVMFGAAVSTAMPGLPVTSLGNLLLGVVLPIPVMQTLLQCPYNSLSFPKVAQPAALAAFPRILHAQIVDTRQALGITLNSGMETVIKPAVTGEFTMVFPAAIPTHFMLATPANGTVDLSGDNDQVAAGSASGAFDLTFMLDAAGQGADYYDIVLHRIDAGGLTPQRIYTVTAPRVRIDGELLAPGVDYVFEVRSFKGHPQVSHGDFAPVEYPYGSAIVFTRTFKTS